MNIVFAFDVDGVLLEPKSSWSVMHKYFGVDNSENLKKFLEGKITYEEFVKLDIQLILNRNKKISYNDFKKIRVRLTPNPNYQDLSSFLASSNSKRIAISGGVNILVERVKDFYPIQEIYSNHLIFQDGFLKCGLAEVSPKRKGEILKKYEGVKVAVGDSIFDEDMFKASDYSILFNSKDEVDADYIIEGNNLSDLTKILSDIYYG